jgi:hypothetical protein
VSEPPWKQSLSRDLVLHGFLAETEEERMAVVMPHIEDAYKRGQLAGSSRAGYRLAQENERLRRERKQVFDWAQRHATQCEGWCCDHAPKLVEMLKNEEDPCAADAPSAESPSRASGTAGET